MCALKYSSVVCEHNCTLLLIKVPVGYIYYIIIAAPIKVAYAYKAVVYICDSRGGLRGSSVCMNGIQHHVPCCQNISRDILYYWYQAKPCLLTS